MLDQHTLDVVIDTIEKMKSSNTSFNATYGNQLLNDVVKKLMTLPIKEVDYWDSK